MNESKHDIKEDSKHQMKEESKLDVDDSKWKICWLNQFEEFSIEINDKIDICWANECVNQLTTSSYIICSQ